MRPASSIFSSPPESCCQHFDCSISEQDPPNCLPVPYRVTRAKNLNGLEARPGACACGRVERVSLCYLQGLAVSMPSQCRMGRQPMTLHVQLPVNYAGNVSHTILGNPTRMAWQASHYRWCAHDRPHTTKPFAASQSPARCATREMAQVIPTEEPLQPRRVSEHRWCQPTPLSPHPAAPSLLRECSPRPGRTVDSASACALNEHPIANVGFVLARPGLSKAVVLGDRATMRLQGKLGGLPGELRRRQNWWCKGRRRWRGKCWRRK